MLLICISLLFKFKKTDIITYPRKAYERLKEQSTIVIAQKANLH